jgi:hypothetical protein
MPPFLRASLVLALLALTRATPAATPPDAPVPPALLGEVYARGRSLDYLTELTDRLGPRLTGSEHYAQAVAWAQAEFRRLGLVNVHEEPVTLEHGWRRGEARARLAAPQVRDLHVLSYGWSPPTPAGGLRARVATLGDTTDEAIAQAGVRDAIVLLDRTAFVGAQAYHHSGEEDWARSARAATLFVRLAAAGAKALLVYSKAPNQVLRTSCVTEDGRLAALPVATVGREDGLLIRRLMASGPVELELRLEATVTGPLTVSNVVAELPGRERPDEWVVLGAHLDSWDPGTGAQDNGSGVAEVMDAARALASLPVRPRRSIRFVLWASEEQGLNGSRAYARAHAGEMRRVVAYLNSDTGAGRPLGWATAGRADVARALAPLSPLLARLGGDATSDELDFDSDTAGFIVAGVPTLDLLVVDDEYDPVVHHKPADTLDKVEPSALVAGTAMMTATAYAVAEAEAPLAKRLSRAELDDVFRAAGARGYVEASSLKDLWHE